jgi:hypothetical protein
MQISTRPRAVSTSSLSSSGKVAWIAIGTCTLISDVHFLCDAGKFNQLLQLQQAIEALAASYLVDSEFSAVSDADAILSAADHVAELQEGSEDLPELAVLRGMYEEVGVALCCLWPASPLILIVPHRRRSGRAQLTACAEPLG